ncbi:putative ABC transport system substrate-binding protein [Comamonas sp. BIGb0124]|uniref:ABC transporter substrate-binding protein n=1 Tax=Comamonas sp. BIGb0124 TaxID=2485130 RepID=UPI000F4AEC26|nr:ABC transporter substrate-binding protein [Comamonas sp. BIGb0124]ROR24324.1 putative ABC transport system substrate-binding protein [Comamonas sp. BIGb0124]
MFKKHSSHALRAAVCAALAALSCALPAAAQQKSVAVTSIVEHPALDAVRDGVKEALQKAGLEDGKTLRWQYQTAQGNAGTAGQIARKFVGDQPDVIVAISTPSAQALLATTKNIPIVFSAVTDPVAGQLTPSWDASGTNVTGVSNALDLTKQAEMIRRILPQAKRVGVVYNPGEANSATVIKQLRELLPKYGMTLVEAAAPRSVDVATSARSLLGKVDLFYTNNDNNVMSAYESIVKVANDAKVPLLSADTDSVKRGAVAAYGIDYHELGLQTGAMVLRILNGEKPGAIKPETGSTLRLFVNTGAAEKQGVALPPDLIQSAQQVFR